jgi:hypothetical protein
LLLARPRGWDAAARLGTALALGLAAWPILWQWVSLLGVRWSGTFLWATVAAGWLAASVWRWRTADDRPSTADNRLPTIIRHPSPIIYHLLLAALLLATLSSRFIAIRYLAFPPWVDSSRHALITAVMVESGRAPADYIPFLPVDHFPYHYGFHALAASLSLMTGRPLPDLLLHLMPLLGGLLPLTVYAAGWMVTRRRAVGLLAAFLVALPFFFPGYYATWGRMTQLTAMLVMPPLLALTWRLGHGWPRVWPLVGALAAGLFLIHFRVFLFYLPFAGLAATGHWFGFRRARGLVKATALATALILPRLIELLMIANPLQAARQSLPGYNDFPIGYVTSGWERYFLTLAAAGVGIMVIGSALRRRWVRFPLLLFLWVGSLFALLAGERLGLPETLIVNLNSMYITLFLPLALFLAIIAGRTWGRVWRWVKRPPTAGRRLRQMAHGRQRSAVGGLLAMLAGIALGLLALFGWRQQVNILNSQTILALQEDAAALAWVANNVPVDARVAVNAWRWLGETWAAGDGGAWITPLTGREATTPPVDYVYSRELFAAVRAFNEAAETVEDWSDPTAAAWLAQQGVSHVFVGQRGGYFDPAELLRNPALEAIYRRDGTFVFAVR